MNFALEEHSVFLQHLAAVCAEPPRHVCCDRGFAVHSCMLAEDLSAVAGARFCSPHSLTLRWELQNKLCRRSEHISSVLTLKS